ncbi:hypothetical protein NKI56_19300 [Mesorhizobium sp. M0622]|uniref:hypothetical protein n=1 Tax=unclassified Mesorhizobium TaxID=325217 RepID=UPI003336FF8D
MEKPRDQLKSLVVRRFPDFDDRSAEASDIARKVFLRRISTYLQGELDPFDICRMVFPIEQKYDFPVWLGGVFDACDWMHESTTREQSTHLREAIEQILAENAECQPFGSK